MDALGGYSFTFSKCNGSCACPQPSVDCAIIHDPPRLGLNLPQVFESCFIPLTHWWANKSVPRWTGGEMSRTRAFLAVGSLQVVTAVADPRSRRDASPAPADVRVTSASQLNHQSQPRERALRIDFAGHEARPSGRRQVVMRCGDGFARSERASDGRERRAEDM